MEWGSFIEVKENLLKSEDIFNLLANLYYICASEFTKIYNLIQNDDVHKKKFIGYFKKFRGIIAKLCEDVFANNFFPDIVGILYETKETDEDDFLMMTWAYLKSIDFVVSADTFYLNKLSSTRCQVSEYFAVKEFFLLFKPRKFIFDEIKKKKPDGKLKIGFDIGQRIEDHLDRIILYEKHISRNIKIDKIDSFVDELLWKRREQLTFVVAPICYDFEYSFQQFKVGKEVPYVFGEIENKEKIFTNVTRALEKCEKESVDIVVFPELSIDGQLRNHIKKWLRENNTKQNIIMVIAGSYHFLIDKEKGRYENSSIVYRYDGVKLWEQKKMNQFTMDEGDIKDILSTKAKGFRSFRSLFDKSSERGWEKIEISDTLEIKDSSIGRMAIAICLDYFVKEGDKLLVEPNVNIVFVPSMSHTLKKFDISNFHMGSFGLASIFCANSCWIITGGEKKKKKIKNENFSYIYIPHKAGLKRLKCKKKSDCMNCAMVKFNMQKDIESIETTEKKIPAILGRLSEFLKSIWFFSAKRG